MANMSLEDKFDKLDEAVKKLESEDITLEESFQIYKEGMELLKQGNADIDKVEKQVMQLNAKGELEEF